MSLGILTMTAALFAAAQDDAPSGIVAGRPRPTMVTLDFEDRTLAEVVAAIDKQSPNRVALDPGPRIKVRGAPVAPTKPDPEPPRFRLQEPAPVTFWEAIERVCRAAGRRPVLEQTPEPRVVLAPASPQRGFVSNDGAFRVTLVALTYAKGVQLAPFNFPAPGHEGLVPNARHGAESFHAALVIMPEPRLRIARLGEVTALAAVDDQGRSLLAPGFERQSLADVPAGGGRREGGVPIAIRLRYPDDPGSFIHQFQGVVSLDLVGKGGSGAVRGTVSFEFTDVPMP